MKQVDSKYALVVAAAKRGRQLTESRDRVVDSAVPKPVTIALQEIADGSVGVREGEGPHEDEPPTRVSPTSEA
jgi:DNA-directed RNA polymerase subunit omega